MKSSMRIVDLSVFMSSAVPDVIASCLGHKHNGYNGLGLRQANSQTLRHIYGAPVLQPYTDSFQATDNKPGCNGVISH